MARQPVFLSERVPGIRGLAALTEPDPDEPVDGIVDVAVIGARGDGKTQFIVHAIRSLRAYGPALAGAEQEYHRDIMRVVLDARAPRPEATAPGVVPHSVFRIRPATLLAGLGGGARAGLLASATPLGAWTGVAVGGGAALGAGGAALGLAIDLAAVAGAGAVGLGAVLAARGAARRFARGGEIEVCFWDVAGEHVFSSSCADYHAFLDALVRERRRRTGGRRYAFAPVLLCNPLGLGVDREGSAYHRLRQLVPLFASLDDAARVLVAVNRWSLVEALCRPDAERDEIVAVREHGGDGFVELRREVVRAWCRDAEDGHDDDVRVTHLRYDAGTRCRVDPIEPPAGASAAVEYRWEDGPGAFAGDARRSFLGWLADLAYRSPAPVPAPLPAPAPLPVEPALDAELAPAPGLPPLGEAAAELWSRRGRAQES